MAAAVALEIQSINPVVLYFGAFGAVGSEHKTSFVA